MSKREVMASEIADNRYQDDETGETVEIGATGGTAADQVYDNRQTDYESWFPDLKKQWREADPLTAPLLSARPGSNAHRQIGAESESAVSERRFEAGLLAALPFHHLVPAKKLAAAFDTMPISLVRPQTVGEGERRRQFFWQSLANAGVTAKEAALLNDSLHCRFTETAAGLTMEFDWEVLYYDDLQGCGEMYRAELLAFKRRIYEASDELRGIVELRANEFLCYLNVENFNVKAGVNDNVNSAAPESRAVIEIRHLERWFLNNLIGSFALTVSELRDRRAKDSGDAAPQKKKMARQSEYTAYRTYGAKRIESSISSGEDDSDDDPMDAPRGAANFSTNVYRLQLTDYWLDWQRAARRARFDFHLLETLIDVRSMRLYELTKLWRLRSFAGTRADLSENEASESIPDTLEIAYEQFAALMPLPPLRFKREVKEQLKGIIKPLRACGYVKSFVVKTDWRGLNNASRLVFRFNDHFND